MDYNPANPGRLAMRLRNYRPEDLDSMVSIEQQCFSPAIALNPDALRRMLSTGADAIVAETDAVEIVGFAIYRKVNRVTGSLLTLDVLPQCRRQGLGSRLVSACRERLDRMGVEKMQLRVALDNKAAQELYDRLGFLRLRVDRSFYPDGSDAFVFETEPWAKSWSLEAVWTRFRERVRHYRMTGSLRKTPGVKHP